MKYKCSKCGNEFPEKFPFCPHCGCEMKYPEEEKATVVEANALSIPETKHETATKENKPKNSCAGLIAFIFGLANASLITFGVLLFLAILSFESNDSLPMFVTLTLLGITGTSIAGIVLSSIGLKKSSNKAFSIIGLVLNILSLSLIFVLTIVSMIYAFAFTYLLYFLLFGWWLALV